MVKRKLSHPNPRALIRERRSHWRPAVPRAVALAVILATISIPLYLALDAIGDYHQLRHYALSSKPLLLLGRSLMLAATVVLAGTLLSLPLAWILARTQIPARRFWLLTLSVPLVIPSYVAAMSFRGTWGFGGLLGTHFDIQGFGSAAIVLTLITYPYILLPLIAAWHQIGSEWEEVALSLGHSRWRSFWAVTLPLLRHPLLSGGLLVALYVLSDFGAVTLLQYPTFTSAIYSYTRSFDFGIGALTSLLLIATATALIVGERKLYRDPKHSLDQISPQGHRLPLGRWKLPCLVALAATVFFSLLLPVAVLFDWAWRLPAERLCSGHFLEHIGNSLVVSFLAATLATLVAGPLALLVVRYRSRLGLWAERISLAGFGLPGVVVALCLISASSQYFPALYATTFLVVLALTIRFLPQATGALRGALEQIPRGLSESALLLSTSRWKRFWKISFPLLAPGVAAGWSLVFLTAMKELPATLLLSPPGFTTLATMIWSFSEEALLPDVGFYSLLLLASTAIPLLFLQRK